MSNSSRIMDVEKREEFIPNRLRRCAGDLLPNDTADQAIEGVDLLCQTRGREKWAGVLLNNWLEAWICGDQVCCGFLE
jgi:hypothetical protein